MPLSWDQVLAWRVHRQHLATFASPDAWPAVAERLCGLHAQVMSSAELTLWARTNQLARNTVSNALWDTRELVKAWAMRGTLHLFNTDDFPLYQTSLASAYRNWLRPAWLKYFGLTAPELEQLMSTLAQALDDGQPRTRNELADAVTNLTGSRALGEKVLFSWGSMLKPAAYRGMLCFAPSSGQNVRFTRPDRWLPRWRAVDPDQARLEVARRYLGTYGPARTIDMRRWWGVTEAQLKRVVKALGDEVRNVDVDGVAHWALARDLDDMAAARLSKSVRLLPGFDQYVTCAPRDGDAILEPKLRVRVYRPQGWISPVLLVDGRMRGVWRHDRKGSRLLVTIQPFADQPRWVERAAEHEAERLAGYLGGRLELVWLRDTRLDAVQDDTERQTPGQGEPGGFDA